MNKKILGVVVAVMIVATLMMCSNMETVRALDFDNIVEYSNEDMKVEIYNSFIIPTIIKGDLLGTVELKSHSSITEVRNVIEGEDRIVMYYESDFLAEESLGDVLFTDMKDGKDIDKSYKIVEMIYETKKKPIYEQECSKVLDKNGSYGNVCINNIIGTEEYKVLKETKEISKVPNYKTTIGLMVDVRRGEHLDAIWTIAGKEIEKHAEWADSLNTDLLDYYYIDEGTGTVSIDQVEGDYNLSTLGGVWTENGINKDYTHKPTADHVTTNRLPTSLGEYSINVWFNNTGAEDGRYIMGVGTIGTGEWYVKNAASGNIDFQAQDVGGTDRSALIHRWHMVTIRINNSRAYMYLNGVLNDDLVIGINSAESIDLAGSKGLSGTYSSNTYLANLGIWNRTLSGAEITQLYNSGDGLFYGNLPEITQNSPVDYYNSSSSDVTFNCSATDNNGILNLTLYINGIVNETIFNITANSNLSLQRILGFPDGIHNWSCGATDDESQTTTSSTRFFTVDATLPTLNITNPTTDVLDGYTTSNERTIYINWSTTDANLDSCWYFNGTANVSITCGDNATFTSSYGTYEFIVYANDTLGNTASDSITATYGYIMLENNITYNSTTYDTSTESFVSNINFSSSAWIDLSAVFNYNGTGFSTSKGGAGNNPTFSSTIDIDVVQTPNNKTFFWTFALTNNSGTFKYNSTTNSQEVKPSIFTACNSSYPTEVVNFSIFEETNPTTSVEVDFEATFEWYLGSGTVVKNKSFDLMGNSTNGNSTFRFCASPNQTFNVDSTIDLSADGYNNRLYEFKNDLFNRTGEIRSLFMLNDTLESSIIIEVKDQGLAPLEGWNVEIWRYYPETGFFEMVENQNTDIYGQFVAKLIQNDVKYKFNFYNPAGDLIKETGKLTVACRTTICVLPFIIEDTTEDFDRFDNVTDYSYTFSYNNNTNVFTFTWTDNTGDDSPIHNLLVKSFRFNESLVVCNTNSSALTGSLTCDVGTEELSYVAQVFRWVDGNKNRISTLSIKVGIGYKTFGKEGLFWSFILLMTLIAVGAWSPVVGVVLYMIGFVVLGFANVISFSPTLFISMLAIGVAFAWAFKS